jgi:hypothetical protein
MPRGCDPALIKAIARGRAWFEEFATGRVRSLQVFSKRDGISRRYIRRLVGLAFLSPQLVEAILQGRQPAELTATRLSSFVSPPHGYPATACVGIKLTGEISPHRKIATEIGIATCPRTGTNFLIASGRARPSPV